jgi:hypothetical protein
MCTPSDQDLRTGIPIEQEAQLVRPYTGQSDSVRERRKARIC